MTDLEQGPRGWYALRRTLPPFAFEANLRELVEQLPRYRVDEIIVKIDTEELSHGQVPLDWARQYQRRLFQIQEALAGIGVRYSLNPWMSLGHADRGRRDRPALPGLQTIVGHDGTECTSCACPLSEAWQRNTQAVWTLYAQTTPHVIWVEDDIRYFNHPPAQFGCFCPLHLEQFSRRAGRSVGREELVAAILQPGPPHPWRALWLDLLGDLAVQTVGWLARTVHAVSPRTHLGLMSSGPLLHALEGRRWKDFTEALADGQTLYSRPPMYNYHEGNLRALYEAADLIRATRACVGPGAVEQSEVDSGPWTRYAKSDAYTTAQIALSAALGCHGATLNLFDHLGEPMEAEPQYGRLLAGEKDFLDGLARTFGRPGRFRGVGLVFSEKASYLKRLPPGASYGHLAADGAAMVQALEPMGVSTTYEDSPVTALAGQTVEALDDAHIGRLLARGVFLDAVAAGVLVRRGFADDIGLAEYRPPVCVDTLGPFGAEEFHHPTFGGAEKLLMTLILPSFGPRLNVGVLTPADGAGVLSHLVDPDVQRRLVCTYAFENRRGGRVVVTAMDLASAVSVAYHNPARRRQLQGIVRWLSRGQADLLVRADGAYPLAIGKDLDDGATALAVLNLSLDDWGWVEVELARPQPVQGVWVLSPAGRWRRSRSVVVTHDRGVLTLRYERPVSFRRPLALRIT